MRLLINNINKDLVVIRKAYKKALSEKNADITSEWLADNYYILEREGRGVIKAFKNSPPLPEPENVRGGERGLPRLYGICLKLCENGRLPDAAALESLLPPYELTIFESEALPGMLRAALLHIAAAPVPSHLKPDSS
jgi:hypothetical protein